MSEVLVQINFKFGVSAEEYTKAVSPLAESFSKIPGLIWKIWPLNDAKSEAGGIMLFENQSYVDEYLKSSLAETVTSHPALSDFSVKQFNIMKDCTEITRGPLKKTVGAQQQVIFEICYYDKIAFTKPGINSFSI